jgi:Flp pilus assembly protein TadD
LAQGDLAGARDSYQQDLKIAEKLAAGDPTNARWQRDLVVSHAKLGQIASRAGDRTLARDEFAAGLTIVEQLCRLDPTNATWRKDAEWLRGQIGQ